ncbi:hypothetical protein LUZ60_003022 [Juncus effusus]|nr:hypothetical protein LUZ60_003022 [Juncus effusus]
MGGTLSNRHGKPRKTSSSSSSVSKSSPAKNSPAKHSVSKNSSPSPPMIKTLPVRHTDVVPPPPPSFTLPVSDARTPNLRPSSSNRESSRSIQDRRSSIQDPSSSKQVPRSAIQDPDTSKQDPITSTHDRSTSKQDPITSTTQDRSASKKDPITSSTQDRSASNQDSGSKAKSDPNESEWKNQTEIELENLLLSKLDKAYNEALSRLIALGYEKPLALRAILSSGHCQGHFDLLTNILKNSIKYLTYPNEKVVTFSNLRELEEHSLSGFVSSLQKLRPDLSRPDAMRYLLAHELHVGEVSGTKLVPAIPNGSSLLKPIQSTTQNAPPELEQGSENEPEANLNSSTNESVTEDSDEDIEIDMDDVHELIHQTIELGTKLGEQKFWAQEKALQAAKKLSNDLMELRVLHMEKESGERMQKEAEERIAELEKQVEEMEKEVKRTTEELERAQTEVRRLETESKEIRAEMEAARLNGAEASKNYKRLEKKVKRLEKNCEVLEMQKGGLKDELAEIKRKKKEVQDELDALRNTIKNLKIKINEETRLKENARKLVEAERKAKELALVNAKKNLQFIANKYELETNWHTGQIEVLKNEISRLKEAIFAAPSSSEKLCRPCIFCGMDEAAVVFLPCRHEVLCSTCGQDYEDIGNERCPTCNLKIVETVYIYGLSAS